MKENKNQMKKDGKIKMVWKKIDKFFTDLLFPENIKCMFCNRDIENFEESPYCDECAKKVSLNDGNRCIICSEPIGNEATVCDSCQKNKMFFKKAVTPFVYDGVVRSSILGYKDSNRRYMAKIFARFLKDEIVKAKFDVSVITFVPMTKRKERARSFNQSKLLAEELSNLLGVECIEIFEKNKDTKGQKYANSKEREENMIGMYSIKSGVHFKRDWRVLIVDDILTTCATVNACSELIYKRVKNVYVAGIARNKLRKTKIDEKRIEKKD